LTSPPDPLSYEERGNFYQETSNKLSINQLFFVIR
jgi:hypothetical protein